MANDVRLIRGCAEYAVDVADTAAHSESFSVLLGSNRRQDVNIKVYAQLTIRSDDYDAPRIDVAINEHQVGRLADEHARGLLRIVRYGKRSTHETFECAALIRGGLGANGYRVMLDLPFEE